MRPRFGTVKVGKKDIVLIERLLDETMNQCSAAATQSSNEVIS